MLGASKSVKAHLTSSSKFFGKGCLKSVISISYRKFQHFKNKNWHLIAYPELRKALIYIIPHTDTGQSLNTNCVESVNAPVTVENFLMV